LCFLKIILIITQAAKKECFFRKKNRKFILSNFSRFNMTGKKISSKLPELGGESTDEARGLRITRLRRLANITKRQMSELLNVNFNTYRKWEWEEDHSPFPGDKIEELLKVLFTRGVYCTYEWLVHGIGDAPVVYPHKADLDKGFYTERMITDELSLICREIMLVKAELGNCIEMKVTDDLMQPAYEKGDYVLGRRKTENIEQLIGEDCIIELSDGRILLRTIEEKCPEGRFTLNVFNGHPARDVMHDVELVSAAKVIRHYKKLNL
jgi:DNA-binding transcriptional regulator YiaG